MLILGRKLVLDKPSLLQLCLLPVGIQNVRVNLKSRMMSSPFDKYNYKEKRINIKNDILPCFSCQGRENLANVVKAEDESYQPQTSVDK